jgi:lysophospholipase
MSSAEFVEIEGNPAPDGAAIKWLEGADNMRLRMCIAPAPKGRPARGTTIVCPGRSEFIEKYFEVARDLQARGFAVVILDWPGQGLSTRLLADSRKGHIDRFSTFMQALKSALDDMQGDLPRPYVSLAHSMGGAIALAAITEKLVEVDAAAFCAPMWGLKSGFMGMKYLAWAMKTLGRGSFFAIRPKPRESFDENLVTHDRARWEMQEDLITARPELELGPITWSWLDASLAVIDQFAKPAALANVKCPVLIATAGEEELVDNDSHHRISRYLINVERVYIEGARHEILMETDKFRDQFWSAFDRLLSRACI